MKLANDLLLFLLVCFIDGVSIFFGSVLGNSLGKAGLFAGALVGGVIGVAAGLALAIRSKLIERDAFLQAFRYGALGFFIAAPIAVSNLDGPVIPVLSVGLVGAGVFLGRTMHRRSALGER